MTEAGWAEPTSDSQLTGDELDAFANQLLGSDDTPFLLVAVSGGSDSMALLHLTAEAVRRAGRGRVLAATVDHRLRAESADEARFVATEAHKVGIAHVTLPWEGPHPATGVQEAARAARYRLLAGVYHVQPEQAKRLLTAHTRDDQAETVLMRLARGSGVEGLSGIAETDAMNWPSGCRMKVLVHRPLLGFPKSRLVATLRARGLPWLEDPSNDDARFERVRVRKLMPVLAELGMGAEPLARSAERLRSARAALAQFTQWALSDRSLVRIDPLGFAEIDQACWTDPDRALPSAIQLRVLAALIRTVGGCETALSLQSIEDVANALGTGWLSRSPPPYGTTLGRTKISRTAGGVRIVREVGRFLPTPIPIAPGSTLTWDNRFDVDVHENAPAGLELRAVGSEGRAILKADGDCPLGIPASVIEALPSLWTGKSLEAVPALGDSWRRIDPARSEQKSGRLGRFARTIFRQGIDLQSPLTDLE